MARKTGGAFVGVEIEGLSAFIRGASKADKSIKSNLRKAGKETAEMLASRTRARASGPWASVYDGLRAASALYPTIALRGSGVYRSTKRGRKNVKNSDIFFGAEFGGRARNTTMQFLPHLGKTGYAFWPTVRNSRGAIAEHYLNVLDEVIDALDEGDTGISKSGG